MKFVLIVISLVFYVACGRGDIEDPSQSMRKASVPKRIQDDLSLADLGDAIQKNIERLETIRSSTLLFGSKAIAKEDYILSLKLLTVHIASGVSYEGVISLIKEYFDFYEVYGNDDWGEVFITSYFAPLIDGSRERTETHSEPLYTVPNDLAYIKLDQFIETNKRLNPLIDETTNKPALKILRGRVLEDDQTGKKRVVPYLTRKQIDNLTLESQSDVLAWVDPIDAFFLHVQGSGSVRFGDGELLRLGYAAQNGHRYESIGKYLLGTIPKEKMSMQSIENYLRTLPYAEMKSILHKNPSYIFFREIKTNPITSFGAETIDGRTIATDRRYFPKGALAYLQFPIPIFENGEAIEPVGWKNSSRFVLDHDTGGAIKGVGRVDLFWGHGKEAARYAGVMKNKGKLYYLVPNDALIEKIKAMEKSKAR